MNNLSLGHKLTRWLPAIWLVGAIVALTVLFSGPTSVKATTLSERTPKSVAYVEVNNNNFNNVAKYSLAGTNQPAFDIGIIFAANINYDTVNKKAQLYFNDQVTQTLDNAATQIAPVQKRGTKVLLSILGNHQGAGFANFTDYASADAFAAQLAQTVEKYHLDGIDFDDEYAEYGKNDTAQPNNSSFIWLLQALRSRLGTDKLITLYNIGPAADNSASNPLMGKLVNYAWNPWYGTWNAPVIAGMNPSSLGAASVEVSPYSWDISSAGSLATRTKNEGYGVFVTYNLPSTNAQKFLSAVTQSLYNQKTTYSDVISN